MKQKARRKRFGVMLGLVIMVVAAGVFVKSAIPTRADWLTDLYGRSWSFASAVSNMKLTSNQYVTGGVQKVGLSFYNSTKVDSSDDVAFSDQCLQVYIYDPFGNSVTIEQVYVNGAVASNLTNESLYPTGFSQGTNNISIQARFTERGKYTIQLVDRYGCGDVVFQDTFTVTNPSGSLVKDSISVEQKVVMKGTTQNIDIEYSVSDADASYLIYVIEPSVGGGYFAEITRPEDDMTIAYLNSDAGDFDVSLGKHKTKLEVEFDKEGCYGVVLLNLTTFQKVATDMVISTVKSKLPDSTLDTSKENSEGDLPFICSANKTHLDLDSDSAVKLTVQFPFHYEAYLTDFVNSYLYGAFSVGDTSVIQYEVFYTPAGSKSARSLGIYGNLKGLLKQHTITLKREDLLKAICDTNVMDSAYAGVVSVRFSMSGTASLYADDIKEEFQFSVAKKAKIVSAKAMLGSVPRAYGETADFSVTSTLGGTAYAEIYKGSTKIATVSGNSQLATKDGDHAFATVSWNLCNSSGKYVAAGTYTAKVYTLTKLKTINNGKTTTKNVKSDVKSVSFKVVKPSGALTLSASAEGVTGGSFATYENPIIGIKPKVSIGSKITITIKNTKGKVIKTYEGVQSSGISAAWFNIQNLDPSFKVGEYSATVKATTLEGNSKSKTIKFSIKKSPKAQISSSTLNVKDGIGTVGFTTSQPANVKVVVKDASGKIKETVIDKYYDAGKISATFATGSLAVGSYNVVVTAQNSGGTSSVTKSFKIAKKPVKVTKPSISGLAIKWGTKNKEDALTTTVSCSVKDAKVVIEVLWDDAEEIVYTYTTTSTKANGVISWTWDGYKSNGFRAATGNYTIRVYAVNSAGKTDYLRQKFVISEG